MSKRKTSTGKRLTASILLVLLLSCCLCITTYALVTVSVDLKDNYFKTGKIDINLNDGKPVIEATEFKFEPGMTVVKDFFVENKSTWAVWYKLYFTEVDGDLKDILEITIKEKGENGQELCKGTAKELDKDSAFQIGELAKGEKKYLTITFYYPKDDGNEGQGKELSFELCAEAVQTKNNKEKAFD